MFYSLFIHQQALNYRKKIALFKLLKCLENKRFQGILVKKTVVILRGLLDSPI